MCQPQGRPDAVAGSGRIGTERPAGGPPDDPGGGGAALLAAALAAGAVGLAMGAYRSGRMLERMLGGVTEHVLRHATLPLRVLH